MQHITQAELKTNLHYDPLTGYFTWLVAKGSRAKVGDVPKATSEGYYCVRINGICYRQHRLAWLYMLGVFPPAGMDVDHIDGVRTNNSWINLRVCSRSANLMNSKTHLDNATGIKGVSYDKVRNKWSARVMVAGKSTAQRYATKEAAEIAVIAMRNKLHGAFARHV